MMLLYACTSENKKMSQSNLVDNDTISSTINKNTIEEVSVSNEPEVILGALIYKLDPQDPKVIYLNTLDNPKNIQKEVNYKESEEAEYITTYLGEIMLNEKTNHVFKQFYTIQAAIEKHGHSVLILVNKLGAYYYEMDLPEDLPIDMKNGAFRFKNKNDTLLMKIEHVSENDLILRNTHNLN